MKLFGQIQDFVSKVTVWSLQGKKGGDLIVKNQLIPILLCVTGRNYTSFPSGHLRRLSHLQRGSCSWPTTLLFILSRLPAFPNINVFQGYAFPCYFPFSQTPPLVLCQFLGINLKMTIWVPIFSQRRYTVCEMCTMGKKSKVNKCPKMPTDDKYWKLISKLQ